MWSLNVGTDDVVLKLYKVDEGQLKSVDLGVDEFVLESGWFDDCCIDSVEEKRRELAIRVLYVSTLRIT
jgi:hypothetical protein